MKNDQPTIIKNATVVDGVKLTSIINLGKDKILVATCIDNFQMYYLLPDDGILHYKFISDVLIMDSSIVPIDLNYKVNEH